MADEGAPSARATSERHTDLLNAYKDETSPWFGWARSLFGPMRLTDWSWGRVALDWEMAETLFLPDGVMFGGHVAAAADQIVSLATMTVLPRDVDRFRTSRLETNYFRPVKGERARIDGRVTNLSRTLIHAEADVYCADALAVRIFATQVRRTTQTIPG
ncbi:MAG: PaaI family thioesterase [Pseudomonadota bacterium]